MRYHNQLIKHDPENGQFGDCFRTCIACLLDLDCPMQVPHVMDGVTDDEGVDAALDKMNKWLSDVWGLRLIELPFTANDLDGMLAACGRYFGDQRYLMVADGVTPGVQHTVVCRGDSIEHCPSGTGITGPVKDEKTGESYYWIGILAQEL